MRTRRTARIPIVLGVLGCIVGLAGGACQTTVAAGISSANDLMFREQYVDAERLYRKLLRRLDGVDQLDDGQSEQQLLILDRLCKINTLYLHNYEQALADYELLVRRHPRTEQAFAARAMVADILQHKLGNLRAAVDEYQRLVAEFPDRSEIRRPQLKIATAYLQLKDYEQARMEAKVVIDRWPGTPEAKQAYIQIANSYYVESRFPEAIATYEKLLEQPLEPSMQSVIRFELGNCYQELGEPDRALEYYYDSLAEHPNPQLVQRVIRRVRSRVSQTRPASRVHTAARRGAASLADDAGAAQGSEVDSAVAGAPDQAEPEAEPEADHAH